MPVCVKSMFKMKERKTVLATLRVTGELRTGIWDGVSTDEGVHISSAHNTSANSVL